jgi:hypothetical protein
MKVVGTFRLIDVKDMPNARLERLISSGLMQRNTVYPRWGESRRELLTLTTEGRELLQSAQGTGDAQRFWSGVVKPNEIEHDLGIYAAYRKEAQAIQKEGGRVRRVVLDYEFKSNINRRMNRAQGPIKDERRKELAEEYELPIIDGKLILPDLRIEYLDAEGHEGHRDVEIVTRHYRGSHRAGKQRSGFRLHDVNGPSACVNDDHHLNWL